MREIKFRAWDKENKEMMYDFHDGELPSHGVNKTIANIQKVFPIMQYTELKDKNDKELWESDIVTAIDDGEELYTAIVECDACNGGFNLRDFDGEYIEIFHNEDKLVVIGNIYENPDLLEAK